LPGYTIDRQGVQWVQIAWVPDFISDPFSKALTALEAETANLNIGDKTTTAGGITDMEICRRRGIKRGIKRR